jgi:hypothetical protein
MVKSAPATAVAALLLVASVAAASGGASSGAGRSIGTTPASATREAIAVPTNGVGRVYITRIYQHGKVVALIGRAAGQKGWREGDSGGWGYGDSGECWITQSGGVVYAGITHDTFGGGRAVGPRKWKVWVGKRLAGLIVWHSRNRWDLIRTSRLNSYGVDMGPLGPAGYTIGPDGPVAGTAFLLLGVCE